MLIRVALIQNLHGIDDSLGPRHVILLQSLVVLRAVPRVSGSSVAVEPGGFLMRARRITARSRLPIPRWRLQGRILISPMWRNS